MRYEVGRSARGSRPTGDVRALAGCRRRCLCCEGGGDRGGQPARGGGPWRGEGGAGSPSSAVSAAVLLRGSGQALAVVGERCLPKGHRDVTTALLPA